MALPERGKEVVRSEILASENLPIGAIITEGASRPLVSEKSPEVRQDAIQQIVMAKKRGVGGRSLAWPWRGLGL